MNIKITPVSLKRMPVLKLIKKSLDGVLRYIKSMYI
jgi:hypothetical protein